MYKILICTTALTVGLFSFSSPIKQEAITASVALSGAVIKYPLLEKTEKHKREDCPVCKGKGWYLSGDGLAKIQCQYCE